MTTNCHNVWTAADVGDVSSLKAAAQRSPNLLPVDGWSYVQGLRRGIVQLDTGHFIVINSPCAKPATPLHFAACQGHLECCMFLLGFCDLGKEELVLNTTARNMALLNGHSAIAQLLSPQPDTSAVEGFEESLRVMIKAQWAHGVTELAEALERSFVLVEVLYKDGAVKAKRHLSVLSTISFEDLHRRIELDLGRAVSLSHVVAGPLMPPLTTPSSKKNSTETHHTALSKRNYGAWLKRKKVQCRAYPVLGSDIDLGSTRGTKEKPPIGPRKGQLLRLHDMLQRCSTATTYADRMNAMKHYVYDLECDYHNQPSAVTLLCEAEQSDMIRRHYSASLRQDQEAKRELTARDDDIVAQHTAQYHAPPPLRYVRERIVTEQTMVSRGAVFPPAPMVVSPAELRESIHRLTKVAQDMASMHRTEGEQNVCMGSYAPTKYLSKPK